MKNVVVCVGLNDESLKSLRTLKKHDLIKNAEKIHFAHCFEIQVYTSEFSPYIFPTEEKFPDIEKSALTILEALAKDILNDKQLANAQFHCFFSHSPKERMREFLEDTDANLAIVATRGIHGIEGLFSSSFAEHMIKYSPCDTYIVRA